jgi:hypothetical protein
MWVFNRTNRGKMGKLKSIYCLAVCLFFCFFSALYSDEIQPFDENSRTVFLATFPRSGNHWARFMIEESTGIATSSVYGELDIVFHNLIISPSGGWFAKGGYDGLKRFPLEEELVVVKTHFPVFRPTRQDPKPYSRAIRIVRHPVETIYSYYLYENKNKIPRDSAFEIPHDFIVSAIESWRRFQEYWDAKEEVLTLRYEDFFTSQEDCLKSMLNHLRHPFSQDDINRSLLKFPPQETPSKYAHKFSSQEMLFIYKELQLWMDRYGYGPFGELEKFDFEF